MLLIVDEPVECFESVLGYERTSNAPKSTSAVTPKADELERKPATRHDHQFLPCPT